MFDTEITIFLFVYYVGRSISALPTCQVIYRLLDEQLKKKPFIDDENNRTQASSYELDLKNLLESYNQHNQSDVFSVMRLNDGSDEQKSQQKSQKGKRPFKQQKSSQYSKIYRQKKKERMKCLEQENEYLKRKVDDLQSRLRQKELELNRLKFVCTEDEYNIQKLNQEITKKLTLITDPEIDKKQLQMKDELKQAEFIQKDKKMPEFLKFFQTYGLGGKRSKQLLEYYMNELLQNVLRDRQKYFLLKSIKKEKQKLYQTKIDNDLRQLLQPTPEQIQRSLKFLKMMKQLAFDLKDTCKQLYRNFKKIIKTLENMHQATKSQFTHSIEFAKKRLKIILWFQVHQHTKQVRNLRAEWIDLIKSNTDEADEIKQQLPKKKLANNEQGR